MRIGIASPIVVQHPSTASPWEATASVTDLVQVAVKADELGFAHLTCSEHIAVPVDVARERGATYWDPLATLSYLAARTSRIRLVTQVLVLGYHHPIALAKRYGTLDVLSGGRVTLGVGVGSLQEEFDLLGVPFDGRGARADEAMQALRAALGVREPVFQGQHYRISDMVVEPHAVQPAMPLWVGGRTLRSLRRAVSYGTGWVPFGLGSAELAGLLDTVPRPPGFEVVLSPGRAIDPIGAAQRTCDTLGRLRSVGATMATVAVAADSVGHYCDQLSALAELEAAR
ncbi:MAG: LLM class F420-dependent oxidoreductase [Jatrophihabitans sp.]